MKKFTVKLLSAFIIIVFIFPILYTISHSFMDGYQLKNNEVEIVPEIFNIQQYYEISVEKNEYFKLYINSAIMTAGVLLGQMIVSIGAAYYFSVKKSRYSEVLFLIYTFFMLLPLQITLIPNVLLYNSIERYLGLRLFNTQFAVILPGVFSTLGVFFLKQFFESMPQSYYEIAKIDGASDLEILLHVVLPYSKNAIAALCLLIFIENWNLIEQPIIFLSSMSKMPVSIYLNTLYSSYREIFYAGSVLFMFPVIYVFMKIRDKLKVMVLKISDEGR
ncbi:carbohydrate ABC transporter permease [Sedimentibacter hydroxybenzoicus DSM 7310]|uniref:Carbohydrate ABC transporter permease n=1 Tax=Sedimentibacter hydroxybenzoicus DSM 7310 TaxID=1123245 RepID=A0A974BM99_SEDHY|nr:carbohydrate ABC transporter permease [Sedimentibacter hydroxybenzoicus]NYB75568.1 carbohydrate ABC transporter permease [Sedimentibacter hydroxybenzoicus DSM 7310]